MKLLRYGPPGGEKPGLLDASGTIRDLSGTIPDLAGEALELGCTRDKRGQVEAEGLFNRSPLPFPGVALAVGAVAADHQPAGNQLRQSSTQSRWRGSVR